MGNIITNEERDLIARIRLVAGKQTEGASDEQILEAINEGKRQMLERAAVLIAACAHATAERQFNVFVENLEYGRIITKVRLRPDKQCIEAFVVECVEDVSAKYWCDIDQLSGPELLGLGDRVQLLLESYEDEQESA